MFKIVVLLLSQIILIIWGASYLIKRFILFRPGTGITVIVDSIRRNYGSDNMIKSLLGGREYRYARLVKIKYDKSGRKDYQLDHFTIEYWPEKDD